MHDLLEHLSFRFHLLFLYHSTKMLLTTVLIPLIVPLLTSAQRTRHDPCGPAVQVDGDPVDTCTSAPDYSGSPLNFGISPLTVGVNVNFNFTVCNVTDICEKMVQARKNGTWYFTSSPDLPTRGVPGCQFGIYLPSDPQGAPKPSRAQCQNIFSAMVRSASESVQLFGSTINLNVNPAVGYGPAWPLLCGSGTGML